MLKVLRDNLKYLSWILWVVILIFIAFVFVDFGGGLAQGNGARASAATVGDRQDLLRRLRAPVPPARSAVPPGIWRELHPRDRAAAAPSAAGARPTGRSAPAAERGGRPRPRGLGQGSAGSHFRDPRHERRLRRLHRRGDVQALRPRQRLHRARFRGIDAAADRAHQAECDLLVHPPGLGGRRRTLLPRAGRARRGALPRAAGDRIPVPGDAVAGGGRELFRAPCRPVPPAAAARRQLSPGRHGANASQDDLREGRPRELLQLAPR